MLKDNEILEAVNQYQIIQNQIGYKFGIDSILLARFLNKSITKKIKILDIGTGNGILPLLLHDNKFISEFDAIDIQEENIDRAKRAFALNNIEKVVNFECIDVKKFYKTNYYDIIVSNPPYMEIDGKKLNDNQHKMISRHEINLNLSDFIKSSKKLLRPIGKLCFIHRTFRLVEIVKELDKNSFSISKIIYIYSPNEKSNMMYIEALKGKKTKLEIESYYMQKGEDYI